MRKLLWIGSFVTGDALVEAQKRGYGNPASVQSQANLVEGLEHAYGQAFDTLGALVLPSYPKIETKFFNEIAFSHFEGAKDCLVEFDNHEFINRLSSKRNLSKKAKEWAYSHIDCDVDVFIYEMRSACLDAAAEVKKIIPSTRINLIVPDLPVYMDLRMSKAKRVLKNIDWRHIKNTLDMIDAFILYAEPMADYLSIHDKKWIVMEGSINLSDIKTVSSKKDHSEKFVVMYSGHVEERFGIKKLADAFQLLPSNFQLWVTGRGTASAYLEELSKKDNRIKYYGFLPNREDLLRLQSQADLFVNMRDPDEKASHYCFPSKLFEYMVTGNPVLTCKLKGIPNEYKDYLYYMENIFPETIAKAIKEISTIPIEERTALGIKAQEFIVNKKNNYFQAERIKSFVERKKGN